MFALAYLFLASFVDIDPCVSGEFLIKNVEKCVRGYGKW
jgi:hypothetical protein